MEIIKDLIKNKLHLNLFRSFVLFTITFAVVFSIIIINSDFTAARSPFAGGEGTAESPYLIEDANQLDSIRDYLDAHFRLTRDIDLTGFGGDAGWKPLGSEESPFTGVFDGQHYSIKNLYIDKPETDKVGFFGHIGEGAAVEDLKIESAEIVGREFVGALAGVNWGDRSLISRCGVEAEITANNYSGGLVGSNTGVIEKSYAKIDIDGIEHIGGAVGQNFAARIENNYAAGKVEGFRYVGGLLGENYRQGEVINSYSAVDIDADVGYGGLVGSGNADPTNYFAREKSGCDDEEGYRGTPADIDELLVRDTYEGWDFEEIWDIKEGESYPYFNWQEKYIPAP